MNLVAASPAPSSLHSPAAGETGIVRVAFDVRRVRADFPILEQTVHGKPLVYLDNAATTHKPLRVLFATSRFYQNTNSNIHRGVHTLSEQATFAYEKARGQAKRYLHANSEREIIFVRGATEAINLVASSWGGANLKSGDEIIISGMEHHANIVPWQFLRDRLGIVLKIIPMNDRGELLLDEYARLLTPRTRLVSVVHVSNSLGTINPVRQIVAMAHERGALALVDGAQAVSHLTVDVQELDADFYVFSGHKLFAPTGIGVLWGRASILEAMPPYQGGGDMIKSVSFEKTTFQEIPFKFEAGTPHIAGAIGLGEAMEYVTSIGLDAIGHHERDLLDYATAVLAEISGLTFIGTAVLKAAVVSFILDGVHPHDIGTILDQEGVAIRTGHHCTQPVMQRFGIPATARASFSFYNTRAEIDVLAAAIRKVQQIFK